MKIAKVIRGMKRVKVELVHGQVTGQPVLVIRKFYLLSKPDDA